MLCLFSFICFTWLFSFVWFTYWFDLVAFAFDCDLWWTMFNVWFVCLLVYYNSVVICDFCFCLLVWVGLILFVFWVFSFYLLFRTALLLCLLLTLLLWRLRWLCSVALMACIYGCYLWLVCGLCGLVITLWLYLF